MHHARLAPLSLFALFAIAAPLAAQQPPVRLQPIGRIGCADCDGPLLFQEIQDIAVLADGAIVVADASAPRIRVFERDGALRFATGRDGAGPGELRAASFLLPRADGIDVVDSRLRRIVRFDARGAHVATHAFPPFPIAVDVHGASGTVIAAATDFASPTAQLWRMARDDTVPRRVATFEPAFPTDRDGRPSSFPEIAATSDGGFVVADGDGAYRIAVHGPDGTVRRVVQRDVPRGRKTDAELTREKDRITRGSARMGARVRAEGGTRDPYEPDPERAFFLAHALQIDAEGRLWVRTTRGEPDATVFDLFDDAGSFLGELRVPARIGIYSIGRDLLAGAVAGPDDAPVIGIWRIIPR